MVWLGCGNITKYHELSRSYANSVLAVVVNHAQDSLVNQVSLLSPTIPSISASATLNTRLYFLVTRYIHAIMSCYSIHARYTVLLLARSSEQSSCTILRTRERATFVYEKFQTKISGNFDLDRKKQAVRWGKTFTRNCLITTGVTLNCCAFSWYW